ncbi:MAG: malectin domain-containing carbohydrate-binding protein [Steroidobacteraceae bacterium]
MSKLKLSMLAVLAILSAQLANAAPGTTELVNVGLENYYNDPGQATEPRITDDGRYIAYTSTGAHLVPDDTNDRSDVFVYDRQSGRTERVSVGSTGAQGNAPSNAASISADGRFVSFLSYADNLVPGDTNAAVDLFVRDRVTGQTERVSIGATGNQSNADSLSGSISANGRYVIFTSIASNLITGDTNQTYDVFLRDRVNGTTERVSLGAGGAQGNGGSGSYAISADGRYVAFGSDAANLVPGDTNGVNDIFVRDRQAGTTQRVNVGTTGTQSVLPSYGADMSDDGRYVTFTAYPSGLVPGDTGKYEQIFVRDRLLNVTERASVNNAGEPANDVEDGTFAEFGSFSPSISASGRYVTFYSNSTNLTPQASNRAFHVFVRDRISGTTTRASELGGGGSHDDGSSSISADGRYVVIPGIYLRDRLQPTSQVIPNGTPVRASAASRIDKSLSTDGRYAVFTSDARLSAGDSSSHLNVFRRDTLTGTTQPASVGSSNTALSNDYSYEPAISGDGRYVAFTSNSALLAVNDTNGATDIFVHDFNGSGSELVSVNDSGGIGDAASSQSSISADGRFVAFTSQATNLVSGDSNNVVDIFVRDRQLGTTERVSVTTYGVQANGSSLNPSISADGMYVAFESQATNLVTGDNNGTRDVFVRNRSNDTTMRVSVTKTGAEAIGDSGGASISADGHFVAFQSSAANLLDANVLPGRYVFLRDLVASTTETISIGPNGATLWKTDQPSISANGRYVAFHSDEDSLLTGCNCVGSVFVRDRQLHVTARASANSAGESGNMGSHSPAISGDGRRVVFTSAATNLVESDTNAAEDVFLRELAVGDTAAIRINAGGGAFTDSKGQLWAADTGFNTGETSTSSGPIAETEDDALYQSVRWDEPTGAELQYSLPAANGSYLVNLYFNESNSKTAYVGARVFNVDIEGVQQFGNVDIYAEARSLNEAVIKTTTVNVTDGKIDIRFRHVAKNPIVSAIEIVPLGSGGSAGTIIRTNAGGGDFTDSHGTFWAADNGFNTGETSVSTAPVPDTTDDLLYQSMRWDDTPAPELEYSYAVPNGDYFVTLDFMETNAKTAYVGARTFDIDVEGTQRIAYDVFAVARELNRPTTAGFNVKVSDGRLNIVLRHRVKNPIISAISIEGR